MSDENINLAGVNFSEVTGSTIQTGDINTTITAGGDVVGRDKIVNNITHLVGRVRQFVDFIIRCSFPYADSRTITARGTGGASWRGSPRLAARIFLTRAWSNSLWSKLRVVNGRNNRLELPLIDLTRHLLKPEGKALKNDIFA